MKILSILVLIIFTLQFANCSNNPVSSNSIKAETIEAAVPSINITGTPWPKNDAYKNYLEVPYVGYKSPLGTTINYPNIPITISLTFSYALTISKISSNDSNYIVYDFSVIGTQNPVIILDLKASTKAQPKKITLTINYSYRSPLGTTVVSSITPLVSVYPVTYVVK